MNRFVGVEFLLGCFLLRFSQMFPFSCRHARLKYVVLLIIIKVYDNREIGNPPFLKPIPSARILLIFLAKLPPHQPLRNPITLKPTNQLASTFFSPQHGLKRGILQSRNEIRE